MPQKEEGKRMLPPISVPKPRGEPPDPMRAPSPPEEPPGLLEDFHGFSVGPKSGLLQSKLEEAEKSQLSRQPSYACSHPIQLLRTNLNMDWGTLVCTKGTAPCSFSTCTTTLSHSDGTPSFRLKPSVESWPFGERWV